MSGEPAIVVGDRKELTYLLCQAAELEHALMCQYLYAAFSLKGAQGPGVGDDQQMEAVGRWRRVVLGIAGEEMLHWAVVQNVLAAVGSAPYVSRPHLPHQAGGYPPGVQLRLLPFGEAALRHFVFLERPEGVERADSPGFEHVGSPPPPMRPDDVVPRGQDFATQGHLYRSIATGLARQMIARYFAFGHETPEQGQVLAQAAVGLMLQAVKPLGLLLARLPAGPDRPGASAGANFQLPYRASFLLPHRRSAWIRFAERLDELAAFAADLRPPEGRDVLMAVSAALGQLASDLAAHVEAV
jgi:hypothetical protein